MRVGIIGGGFGLRVQAPLIRLHPDMEVAAVSTMMRHELPDEWTGCKQAPVHYKDWTEMLDREELELLVVSSLPSDHFRMVKRAIEKGLPVICEKPFAMNSQESGKLLEMAAKSQAKIVVDFEWRYLPVRQKVKELITNGAIGQILHFEYHISSPQYARLLTAPRGWMGEKSKFGGMLGAVGSHMIDCLRWLAQDEIEIVRGTVHTHVPQGAEEIRDADDAFFVHGMMSSGFTFSIQFLSGVHHGFGSQLKIFGNKGTVTLTDDRVLRFGEEGGQLTEIAPPSPKVAPSCISGEAQAYFPAFYPFLDKVYRYIKFGQPDADLPLIEDGHRNQAALDRILGS